MSIINDELKFQLLLLRCTFGNASGAASIVTLNDSRNAAHSAAHDAINIAAHLATHDVTHVACSVTYFAYVAAFYATWNFPEKLDFDDNLSVAFREILKLDNKIQDVIKNKAMTTKGEIPIDYKSPKTELELVSSLLDVDISRVIPLIQTYWMYSIHNMILTLNDIMVIFNEKRKKLNIPKEYSRLLECPELYLGEILIGPLKKIVEEYYGLMEREIFIAKLLELTPIK